MRTAPAPARSCWSPRVQSDSSDGLSRPWTPGSPPSVCLLSHTGDGLLTELLCTLPPSVAASLLVVYGPPRMHPASHGPPHAWPPDCPPGCLTLPSLSQACEVGLWSPVTGGSLGRSPSCWLRRRMVGEAGTWHHEAPCGSSLPPQGTVVQEQAHVRAGFFPFVSCFRVCGLGGCGLSCPPGVPSWGKWA